MVQDPPVKRQISCLLNFSLQQPLLLCAVTTFRNLLAITLGSSTDALFQVKYKTYGIP